jgi:dihydrofolate synthase/folylpolyglutamate synthase
VSAWTGGPIRDVDQAGAYLESLINFERKPKFSYARLGLEPIEGLLARLGHPERGLSIIHVAGSKGKGSVCLLAEAILAAAGESVGTFTSPHLERWSERFRIDGAEVAGEALARAVEQVRPHVDRMRDEQPDCAPTFFDATTAVALLLFAQARVSRVLLEVGLGGRLDSTNAVTPAVTVVTSIELEHTDKLGDTLAAVAGEKAGILKPGVPCIRGALTAEAADVVDARAHELGAPLTRLGGELEVRPAPSPGDLAGLGVGGFRYCEAGGFEIAVNLPIVGEHQRDNAALAIAAVRSVHGLGPATARAGSPDAEAEALVSAAITEGLAHVHLPGRLEIVEQGPWVLIDAAHTPASAARLREVLDRIRAERRSLVLSVSGDKDVEAILAALLPWADRLWLTRADRVRSMDPVEVAARVRALRPGLQIDIEPDPAAAVRAARAACADADALCVAGSVYLAGAARGVLCGVD